MKLFLLIPLVMFVVSSGICVNGMNNAAESENLLVFALNAILLMVNVVFIHKTIKNMM